MHLIICKCFNVQAILEPKVEIISKSGTISPNLMNFFNIVLTGMVYDTWYDKSNFKKI